MSRPENRPENTPRPLGHFVYVTNLEPLAEKSSLQRLELVSTQGWLTGRVSAVGPEVPEDLLGRRVLLPFWGGRKVTDDLVRVPWDVVVATLVETRTETRSSHSRETSSTHSKESSHG